MIRSQTHRDGGHLQLVIDQPKGNIISLAVIRDLRTALAAVHRLPLVKLVTLEGAGDHFSYGASVEEHQPALIHEALGELQSHIEGAPGEVTYKMITVQTHRPLSDAVAQRLGLRHETPQAILLRDGKIVWTASHFRITATQLDDVMKPKA